MVVWKRSWWALAVGSRSCRVFSWQTWLCFSLAKPFWPAPACWPPPAVARRYITPGRPPPEDERPPGTAAGAMEKEPASPHCSRTSTTRPFGASPDADHTVEPIFPAPPSFGRSHQAAADLETQIFTHSPPTDCTRRPGRGLSGHSSPAACTLDSLVTYLGNFAQDFLSLPRHFAAGWM